MSDQPTLGIKFTADLTDVRAALQKLEQDAARGVSVPMVGGSGGGRFRRRTTAPAGDDGPPEGGDVVDRWQTRYENRLVADRARAEREQQRQAVADARIAAAKEKEAAAAERNAERQAASEARSNVRGYKRELRDYVRSQNYQDRNAPQPPELPGDEEGQGEVGPRRRRGFFRMGQISRYATAGFLAREVLRMGQSFRDDNANRMLAGNDQEAQLAVDQKQIDFITNIPVFGQIADLATDPTGARRAQREFNLRGRKKTTP